MSLEQKALLEKFLADNEALPRLESLLGQFNIFEAVGMDRQEIRHSKFLAFLLNPANSHKLGDTFLKAFLKDLLAEVENAPLSTSELDATDLTDTQVRREWKFIDVLLFSPSNKVVCAIENKVDSQEHSNQLQRYRDIVLREFPDFKQIFVYLTRTGISPYKDEDQQHWLTYSYKQIACLIDGLGSIHCTSTNPEVHSLMQHYSTLIKRRLMEDSEVAQLSREIYWKHKDALDLIFDHRPNPESDIFELLRSTVKNTSSKVVVIKYTQSNPKTIGFAVPDWDNFPFQKTSTNPKRKQMLVFEFKIETHKFKIETSSLNFYLTMAQGSLGNRLAIFESLKNKDISGFTNAEPKNEKKWVYLIARTISEDVKPEGSVNGIPEKIDEFWQDFLKKELPKITQALTEESSPANRARL